MLLFKSVEDSVLDVDDKSRRVKVIISQTGSKDLDNDVIDSGAFAKTVAERGPNGSKLIWHLTDHMPMLKSAVGKFKELYMDGANLVGVTDVANTQWGSDVLEFYKSGAINQHSIGFSISKSEWMNEDDPKTAYRVIKEVKLYEGSAVLWGANPNTPMLSVGKGATKEQIVEKFLKEYKNLCHCLKDGNFTDDTAELIEIRIEYIGAKFKSLLEATASTSAEVTTSLKPEIEKVNEFKKQLDLIYLTI